VPRVKLDVGELEAMFAKVDKKKAGAMGSGADLDKSVALKKVKFLHIV
jgi:hypothetical protein